MKIVHDVNHKHCMLMTKNTCELHSLYPLYLYACVRKKTTCLGWNQNWKCCRVMDRDPFQTHKNPIFHHHINSCSAIKAEKDVNNDDTFPFCNHKQHDHSCAGTGRLPLFSYTSQHLSEYWPSGHAALLRITFHFAPSVMWWTAEILLDNVKRFLNESFLVGFLILLHVVWKYKMSL